MVLVAPPPILEVGPVGELSASGAVKSRELARLYRQVAGDAGAYFFDAGKVVEVSPIDGVHLASDQRHLFGKKFAEFLLQLGHVRGNSDHEGQEPDRQRMVCAQVAGQYRAAQRGSTDLI